MLKDWVQEHPKSTLAAKVSGCIVVTGGFVGLALFVSPAFAAGALCAFAARNIMDEAGKCFQETDHTEEAAHQEAPPAAFASHQTPSIEPEALETPAVMAAVPVAQQRNSVFSV